MLKILSNHLTDIFS